MASMDWAKTTARQDKKHLSLEFDVAYTRGFTICICNSNNSLTFYDAEQKTKTYLSQYYS